MNPIEHESRRLELDDREQRLVERVTAALRGGQGIEPALRMRVRNRCEKYRELVKRQRLGGAPSAERGLAERAALFERLLQAIESHSDGAA